MKEPKAMGQTVTSQRKSHGIQSISWAVLTGSIAQWFGAKKKRDKGWALETNPHLKLAVGLATPCLELLIRLKLQLDTNGE